jgi:transposase
LRSRRGTPPTATLSFVTATRTRPYWATNALDKVRRAIWNQTRRAGQQAQATELKGSRWLLLRNAQDLTANETAKLALVAKLNAPLYRAYRSRSSCG